MIRQSKISAITRALSLSAILVFSSFTNEQSTSLQGNYIAEAAPEVPKRLERKFRRDAARLALRLSAEQEDLRYQNINISRDNIETFYNLLASIYLKDDTAKSIADCNVHTFPDPSIDRFVVIFDKNIAWAEPLQMGISETDSEEFNELLDEYNLVLDKHVQWNDTQDAITIRSKEPLNIAALANEFYNIEGVEEIDLGIPKVGGNDIQVRRIESGWAVHYILRFGSQITGDGKQHTWVYQAGNKGEDVQLIKEDGDIIPEWLKCQLVPAGHLSFNQM